MSLAGGTPVSEFAVARAGARRWSGWRPWTAVWRRCGGGAGGGLALGTAEGVVKRVLPDYPQNRDEFELIALRDGDRVVGAVQLSAESDELVFITSDAQLLRFAAVLGAAAGPGGRRHGRRPAVFWRVRRCGSARWTPASASGHAVGRRRGPTPPPWWSPWRASAGALPGTGAGSVKVTPLHEYPGKGRATGGVRCHRFLKGEDMLVMAWAGPAPAVAATESGAPVQLPDPVGKRDGSGVALGRQVAVIGGSVRVA